ncbi:MAG: iron transporter substrate-binding protein [Verrucomicrobia bacterium]|nr:iron transporter substrate-binding protein [Verrucomicrobiota bacterium]
MIKRVIIVAALVATVALPFLLRPKRPGAAKADVTVVIITPHNEAIRSEFTRGFSAWYRERTGKTVAVDWRVIGGTSDIARFLEAEYVAAFRNHWTNRLGKPWSAAVQAGFSNPRLPADAPPVVQEARKAFLESNVSCGMDLFFGGGSYDFIRQAEAGRIVSAPLLQAHPDWFREDVIPQNFAGEAYWDPEGRWYGNVLSTYGVLYNRDSLARLGIGRPPEHWDDLSDPRLYGEIGLADPTKSSSMAKAFENLIQQKIQRRLAQLRAASPAANARDLEPRAVADGWLAGLRLVQRIGANGRYFTDSSQKSPIDVAQGDCAVGIAIDFYGRAQAEVTEARGRGTARLAFVTPRGGTVASVDPIALLRGARNRETAEAFMEYTLSMEGQKLWNFKPGTPGGPQRFALRRLPVRKDFYARGDWRNLRSDPDASPFADEEHLVYRPEWTGWLYRELAFVIRVMCLDTHSELKEAWHEIIQAGSPPEALAVLGDLSEISYDRMDGIRRRLNSKDKVDEVRLANELAQHFRRQYERAAEIAREVRKAK